MRRSTLVCSAFVSFILAGCSSAGGPSSYDDPVGEAQSPIVFGTQDTTHSAVVAVLALDGQGFDECSGSIVQVQNGDGYVLTAAHCCGGDPMSPSISPTIVVTGNNYTPGENYLGNPNPPAPPAYAVVAGSVSWDQAYNGMDHDFCMLRFSGATASTPTIQLPQAGADDGLKLGVSVEYVGYGVTVGTGNNNNSLRYHATAPVNQTVDNLIIKYSEGNGIGGPCEGDSGGPALLPAGADQSQQTVVATTSYGDQTCAQFGVSSRVSSEIGPNGFITSYIANGGTSGSSGAGGGGTTGTCDSCQQAATINGGACYALLQTCEGDAACLDILKCQNACATTDETCVNNCYSSSPSGQADYDAVGTCICTQGCTSQCASLCGNSGAGGASSTSSSAATTGTSSTGSTTGSVNPASGSGVGNSTGTGTGNGNSGAGGDDTNEFPTTQKSSCAFAIGGDTAPSSSAALGGLFLAAALAMSRRRRMR